MNKEQTQPEGVVAKATTRIAAASRFGVEPKDVCYSSVGTDLSLHNTPLITDGID